MVQRQSIFAPIIAGPPYVMDFTKSKNLIEKDKMELQCRVLGFPKAVVTWLKDDVPLNVSLDERIELHTLDGYKNARLVIKNIEFSDEGEYACHAFSSSFNQSDTKTITVRVKGKCSLLFAKVFLPKEHRNIFLHRCNSIV